MTARPLKLLSLYALASLASAQPKSAPDVPQAIKAPPNETIVLQAHATGAQIYVCQETDGEFRWTLKAPDARLHDQKGAVIGRHYAGPTWKLNDGSEVRGKVTGQAPSPVAGSIPWLLLIATDHSGAGALAGVTSIQRIHTQGGQPPAPAGCTSSTLGVEHRSDYSADYYFFAPASPPR